jgi:hypothetical protein
LADGSGRFKRSYDDDHQTTEEKVKELGQRHERLRDRMSLVETQVRNITVDITQHKGMMTELIKDKKELQKHIMTTEHMFIEHVIEVKQIMKDVEKNLKDSLKSLKVFMESRLTTLPCVENFEKNCTENGKNGKKQQRS